MLIERYDLFSPRKYFQHETEDYLVASEDGKGLTRRIFLSFRRRTLE